MAVGGYGAPVGPVGASPMPGSLAAFPRPMDPFSALLARLGIGGGSPTPYGPRLGQPMEPTHPLDVLMPPQIGPRRVDPVGGPIRAPEVGVPAPSPSPATVSDFQHVLNGLQPGQNRFSEGIAPPHRASGQIGEGLAPGLHQAAHLGGEHPVAALLRFLRMQGHPESASSMHVHQRNKNLLSHQARIQGL